MLWIDRCGSFIFFLSKETHSNLFVHHLLFIIRSFPPSTSPNRPSKVNTSIYFFCPEEEKNRKNWRYYTLIRLNNPSKLIRDGRTATININWPLQQDIIMDDHRKNDAWTKGWRDGRGLCRKHNTQFFFYSLAKTDEEKKHEERTRERDRQT